jgi:hypothetical protein
MPCGANFTPQEEISFGGSFQIKVNPIWKFWKDRFEVGEINI